MLFASIVVPVESVIRIVTVTGPPAGRSSKNRCVPSGWSVSKIARTLRESAIWIETEIEASQPVALHETSSSWLLASVQIGVATTSNEMLREPGSGTNVIGCSDSSESGGSNGYGSAGP